MTMAATGEGTHGWIPHTYGIIERYIPGQLKPMRAANQQRWQLDFTAINQVHVPVALASMLLLAAMVVLRLWRRRRDDLTWLAATVTFAVLGNASSYICFMLGGRRLCNMKLGCHFYQCGERVGFHLLHLGKLRIELRLNTRDQIVDVFFRPGARFRHLDLGLEIVPRLVTEPKRDFVA